MYDFSTIMFDMTVHLDIEAKLAGLVQYFRCTHLRDSIKMFVPSCFIHIFRIEILVLIKCSDNSAYIRSN